MISLLVLGLLLQVKAKAVPPPVPPCLNEGKASSVDSKGKVTESKECFDNFITTNVFQNNTWGAVFSEDYKKVVITDPRNQLECRVLEIQGHQGFMLVCTTK